MGNIFQYCKVSCGLGSLLLSAMGNLKHLNNNVVAFYFKLRREN